MWFAIATSDKGYTDTVKELRRQGKKVVGIGEKKAPKELRDACSEFFWRLSNITYWR